MDNAITRRIDSSFPVVRVVMIEGLSRIETRLPHDQPWSTLVNPGQQFEGLSEMPFYIALRKTGVAGEHENQAHGFGVDGLTSRRNAKGLENGLETA